VTKPSAALQLKNSKIIEAGHDTMPGGKEIQEFVFEPIATGSGQIQFGYRQPWQKDRQPDRTVILHVDIGGTKTP
jgi:predicted secreted protein